MAFAFPNDASEWKQTPNWFHGICFTVTSTSLCCFARWIIWLAKTRSLTLGFGKHCWLNDVWVAKSGLLWLLSQLQAPLMALKAATSRSFANASLLRNRSFERLIGRRCSAYSFCPKEISNVAGSCLYWTPQNSPLPIRHFLYGYRARSASIALV